MTKFAFALGLLLSTLPVNGALAQQSSDAKTTAKPAAAAGSTVQLQTTISGNQEQPKTIYILPWQNPVSVIRIPGQPLTSSTPSVSPLDRQQFLRFIALQQGNTPQLNTTEK